MVEFLLQYSLFALKFLTATALIVFGIGFIISLSANKAKGKGETIAIDNINDKFDEMRDAIEVELLTKDEHKALEKQRKKEDKKEEKERKKRAKSGEDEPLKPRLFVLRFEGDMEASEVENLRSSITTVLSVAKKSDEVLLLLESPGGIVHNYGLAASQLTRIKNKGIKLIIAVDLIAASGGYMMACVADKIIAAPFAVLGSVGVLAEIPNFNRFLDKMDVDIEHHTAGEYKSTLTMLAKNTDKSREKFQQELEDIHVLFKDFVSTNRPALDMAKVATGEAWYGTKALALNLVDEIQTSDDYLVEKSANSDIFEINFEVNEGIREKLSSLLYRSSSSVLEKFWYKLRSKYNHTW